MPDSTAATGHSARCQTRKPGPCAALGCLPAGNAL